MAVKKRSRKRGGVSLRDKIHRDSDRQEASGGAKYNYLTLPKGLELFEIDKEGGTYTFDFLSYKVTDEAHMDRDVSTETAVPGTYWWKKPYYTHKNVGPNRVPIVCPAKTYGLPCPICEERKRLMEEEGLEWNDDQVKVLNPSLRNLYVVLPPRVKGVPHVPMVFDMSHHLFQKLFNEELRSDEDYYGFLDEEDGYSVKARFSKEVYKSMTFPKVSKIDFVPRERAIPSKVFDMVPDLDDLLVVHPYDEILATFEGISLEDAKEQAEETKARKSRKRRTVPKEDDEIEDEDVDEKGWSEDEDEDEDDEIEDEEIEEEDEDAEEEEVEEDEIEEDDDLEDDWDEDEDEEEEEEEEEKPAPKRKRKTAVKRKR